MYIYVYTYIWKGRIQIRSWFGFRGKEEKKEINGKGVKNRRMKNERVENKKKIYNF